MQLNNYNLRDLRMYLDGTYGVFDGKPARVSGLDFPCGNSFAEGGLRIYLRNEERSYVKEILPTTGNLLLTPIRLGYVQLDDFVVFLYHKQDNSYKKLPTQSTIKKFLPQAKEFDSLYKTCGVNLDEVLLMDPKYPTLEEAYALLDSGYFSVALHTNYALVKKGRFKNPVIYYMKDAVIECTPDYGLVALVDECHVTKFKLELDIL